MKHWRAIAFLAFAAGCASVDRSSAPASCPLSQELASRIEVFKTVTVESRCAPAETCNDGPYTCTCDVARGGAPRPNRWQCRRARAKTDGCPDDDALLRGDACSSESQTCEVPRACGCYASSTVTCERGHWVLQQCERCLAP